MKASYLPTLCWVLGYSSEWNIAFALLKNTAYWGTLYHNLHKGSIVKTVINIEKEYNENC